ncbi:MAG: hypothetical protein HFJ30_00280 [Clostridia bacterium]|jgi:predicted patatin/cPLA2 family phospholipase|nr:hypothetical protein [Clostridia bacterium]
MQNKEIEEALYWLENECEPIYDDHEESIEELLQKQLNNYNSIKQYIDQLEKENLALEIQRRISLLDLHKESSTIVLKNILNILEVVNEEGD